MDKLIELLDEFRKNNKRELFWEPWTLVPLTWKDFIELNRLIIISKEYWFIKRLVDNDKIDFSREWDLSTELVNLFERKLDNADWVIALLSISDAPILDLISYLR